MILRLPERGVTIRPVGVEAMPALLELYHQCEDFLALGPEPHASPAVILRDLDSMRAEGSQFHGIYAASGALLGVLDVIPQGCDSRMECAYIELLMLRPGARGSGLGSAIIHALEATLATRGVSEIEADVQVNNPAAQRFWQCMGFEVIAGPVQQADTTITFRLWKKLTKKC